MYVAGAEAMTSSEVGINCCLTSLDDITNATPKVTGLHQSGAVVLVVAHVVAFALSLTGNTIVLYVIGRHLGYRTATNVFITTLCVTDMATALVCLPLACASVTLSRWSLGGEMTCVAYDVIRRSLLLLSTSMTSALVVDRYMTVVRLRRVQTVTQRTLMTVAALVTFSVLASLPWYLVVISTVSTASVRSSWFWPPLCLLEYVEVTAMYDVVYVATTSGFSAAGLACCAARVLKAVLRSTTVVRPSTSSVGQLLFQDELQTATTVILLVVVFVACRCVHCVFVGLAAWTSARYGEVARPMNSPVLLDSAASLAVAVNGAINPAVYALRNPNVARVLHLGRQQRYGGYVTDDAASSSATRVAATVSTANSADTGGALSDRQSVAEQSVAAAAAAAAVPQNTNGVSSDATMNSLAMTRVVPVDSTRQRTDVDQRPWSMEFSAWRTSSSTFSGPGVIYNVTSRRKSSQSSTRTSSTLTSVVR